MKKIYIGSDHGGYKLKEEIISYLNEKGIDFVDVGTDSEERTDYPIYAKKLAEKMYNSDEGLEKDSFGILICKSGHGMVIAANKFKGIRASLAFKPSNLKLGIEDDDINVIGISSIESGIEEAKEFIDVIASAEFKGNDRYLKRLEMIESFEK